MPDSEPTIVSTRHVVTKSIAGYHIFRTEKNFLRMLYAMQYYQYDKLPDRLSNYLSLSHVKEKGFQKAWADHIRERGIEKKVSIIAYCLMSTHLHLILRDIERGFLAQYMNKILNSYTRYFNTHYDRKGPLWQGRYKQLSAGIGENLRQAIDYVHLNPTTAYLVQKPEKWKYSSYNEYLNNVKKDDRICEYEGLVEVSDDFGKKTCEQIEAYRLKTKQKSP